MSKAEDEAEQIATVFPFLISAANMLQSSFWISRKRKRDQAEPSRRPLDFPHLLDGEETDAARDLRKETFTQLWSEQEDAINVVILGIGLMVGYFGDVS
jgi:hypothetical protein